MEYTAPLESIRTFEKLVRDRKERLEMAAKIFRVTNKAIDQRAVEDNEETDRELTEIPY